MTTLPSGAGIRSAGSMAGGSGAAQIIARGYSMTWAGALYHITTLFLAIGAINGQNNLLFWAFGLALGAILAGGIVSGMSLMSIRAERLGLEPGEVGQVSPIRYAVSSTGRWMPSMGLSITEPGGKRPIGVSQRIAGVIAHVPPGGRVVTQGAVVPTRRGVLALDRFVLSSSFPFGTLGKLVRFSQPGSMLVRPGRMELRPGLLDEVLRSARAGEHTTRSVGQGEELYGIREYRPGDPIREVAWGPSARTGDLLIRQRSSERGSRLRIQLELAREAGEPANERAIAVAAQLARDGIERGLMVGLSSGSLGIDITPAGGGKALERMLDALTLADASSLGEPGGVEAGRDPLAWVSTIGPGPLGAIDLSGEGLLNAGTAR